LRQVSSSTEIYLGGLNASLYLDVLGIVKLIFFIY
jgi:hypothetical protein